MPRSGTVARREPLPTRTLLLQCHRVDCRARWYTTETLVSPMPPRLVRDDDRCPACGEHWSISVQQSPWRDL